MTVFIEKVTMSKLMGWWPLPLIWHINIWIASHDEKCFGHEDAKLLCCDWNNAMTPQGTKRPWNISIKPLLIKPHKNASRRHTCSLVNLKTYNTMEKRKGKTHWLTQHYTASYRETRTPQNTSVKIGTPERSAVSALRRHPSCYFVKSPVISHDIQLSTTKWL